MLDRSALLTGVTQWCEAQMHRGFTALMYHRVLPDEEALRYPFRSLAMPKSAFAAQMNWLAEHFTVLPMRECVEKQTASVQRDKPLVAVTFDDGYIDNATIAAPILEDAGLRGTFFITSEFVSTGEPLWFDRLALAYQTLEATELRVTVSKALQVESPSFATLADWMAFAKDRTANERDALLEGFSTAESSRESMNIDQLRALHTSGHEIGAHTCTHPLLPDCEDAALSAELCDSKRELEAWIDAEVPGFAYPNGDHDERVTSATRSAGYAYACTTSPGLNAPEGDPFTLTRLDVTRDRVFDSRGRFDNLAFRSEVCRVRRFMRAG